MSSTKRRVVVVGGGLAGVAAATVLAERGASVTLVERDTFLGGRAGAWPDRLADGTAFEMERGFHAFFRHYENVRALIRRVDPSLSCLTPLSDYPLIGPDGASQSFAGLPSRAPLNVVALMMRSPHIKLRDLAHINLESARRLLSFDHEATYREMDGVTAKDFLDSLRFPLRARQMLFDVFAHSFFNPESDYSAAELLAMFHFYFTANSRGLVFDVANEPFSFAVFRPFERYLAGLGVRIEMGTECESIEKTGDTHSVVVRSLGLSRTIEADAIVLAVTVPGLKAIVSASPSLDALAKGVASLDVTLPFAVHRLWLDRPCASDRAPFAGTAGLGILDNISLFEKLEGQSREWARDRRGSVVELHAYAVPEDATEADLRASLVAELYRAYPETREARILEERFLLRRDCPSFKPGSHALRPTVETPIAGVVLAGDFVRLPFPSALMERAVSSGFLAANVLLDRFGLPKAPVAEAPTRGLLRFSERQA